MLLILFDSTEFLLKIDIERQHPSLYSENTAALAMLMMTLMVKKLAALRRYSIMMEILRHWQQCLLGKQWA
jgi:hypothetical protein